MDDKPKRNSHAARPRKSIRYWIEAIESGKLSGPDLALAIRQVEKHEAKKAKVERAPDLPPRVRATVTNPGAIAAFESVKRQGFKGTFDEWIASLKAKGD